VGGGGWGVGVWGVGGGGCGWGVGGGWGVVVGRLGWGVLGGDGIGSMAKMGTKRCGQRDGGGASGGQKERVVDLWNEGWGVVYGLGGGVAVVWVGVWRLGY